MILGTAAMIVMWTVSLVFCLIAFLRGEQYMANQIGEFLTIFLLGVAWGIMLPLIGDVNRNRRVVWTWGRKLHKR